MHPMRASHAPDAMCTTHRLARPTHGVLKRKKKHFVVFPNELGGKAHNFNPSPVGNMPINRASSITIQLCILIPWLTKHLFIRVLRWTSIYLPDYINASRLLSYDLSYIWFSYISCLIFSYTRGCDIPSTRVELRSGFKNRVLLQF